MAAVLFVGGCSSTPEVAKPPPPAPPPAEARVVAVAPPVKSEAIEPARVPVVVVDDEPVRFHCGGGELIIAGDRPYCLQREATPFRESVAWCKANGGALTTIVNDDENRALQAALRSPVGLEGSVWIGLGEPREGDWRWPNGTRVGFTNWEPNEPNDAGGEDCGELHARTGRWNDLSCEAALPFLCESRVRGAKLKCAVTPFQVGGTSYCHDSARVGNWADAERACRQQGGTLATFLSAAEVDGFRAAVGGRLRSDRAWLGMTDEDHEGRWTDTNGKAVTFTRWRPGEPNNAGTENCAEWYVADAGWNDIPCNQPHIGICGPRLRGRGLRDGRLLLLAAVAARRERHRGDRDPEPARSLGCWRGNERRGGGSAGETHHGCSVRGVRHGCRRSSSSRRDKPRNVRPECRHSTC